MSGRARLTTEMFAERGHIAHQGKYDYAKVMYVDNHSRVIITYPRHGDFLQLPANHMRGLGCKKCRNEDSAGQYHKKTTVQFVAEAKLVHGDKYDYSLVDYRSTHIKVEIICPDHGSFAQTPASHTKTKCGCPECKKLKLVGGYGHLRFKNSPSLKDKPGVLYVVRIWNDTEQFLKVGITVESLEKRFSSLKGLAGYEHEVVATTARTAYEVFLLEQDIKAKMKKKKHRPEHKFPGHTECFTTDALDELLGFAKGK